MVVKEIGTQRKVQKNIHMTQEEAATLESLAKEQGISLSRLLRESPIIAYGELLPIGWKILLDWDRKEAGDKARAYLMDFAQRHPNIRASILLAEKYRNRDEDVESPSRGEVRIEYPHPSARREEK